MMHLSHTKIMIFDHDIPTSRYHDIPISWLLLFVLLVTQHLSAAPPLPLRVASVSQYFRSCRFFFLQPIQYLPLLILLRVCGKCFQENTTRKLATQHLLSYFSYFCLSTVTVFVRVVFFFLQPSTSSLPYFHTSAAMRCFSNTTLPLCRTSFAAMQVVYVCTAFFSCTSTSSLPYFFCRPALSVLRFCRFFLLHQHLLCSTSLPVRLRRVSLQPPPSLIAAWCFA